MSVLPPAWSCHFVLICRKSLGNWSYVPPLNHVGVCTSCRVVAFLVKNVISLLGAINMHLFPLPQVGLASLRDGLACSTGGPAASYPAIYYPALPADKQIDLSTVDLKKLRVKELKKILDDWGEMCKGCAEKSDYIRKINELMPKYAPKAASARTDL